MRGIGSLLFTEKKKEIIDYRKKIVVLCKEIFFCALLFEKDGSIIE
jgi:hypothetical protein